jgi:hypothetical protein
LDQNKHETSNSILFAFKIILDYLEKLKKVCKSQAKLHLILMWNLMWNHDHVQGVYWLNEEEKKKKNDQSNRGYLN